MNHHGFLITDLFMLAEPSCAYWNYSHRLIISFLSTLLRLFCTLLSGLLKAHEEQIETLSTLVVPGEGHSGHFN